MGIVCVLAITSAFHFIGCAKAPKPVDLADKEVIAALEGKVAQLQRMVDTGTKTNQYTGLINAHEHLFKLRHLENYLPAAREAGVAATVVVASPDYTIYGKGAQGEPSMSKNLETLLKAAKAHPGEIIPFATIDPKDPDKLQRLKDHVAAGAKGLKIYSGHSNFWDGELARDDMEPVLAWLEETQLPVNWHINLNKFITPFEAVLTRYPKLNVMVPHYGVAFWQPKGPTMGRIGALMDKHPNFFVDTSLGTREILLDGMASIAPERESFRAFFAAHPDRVIWGTDSVITGNPEKTTTWYHKVIWATRDHLEQDTFTTDLAAAYSIYFKKGRDADGRYAGLHLSPEILQKVYVDNARRWLHLPAGVPADGPIAHKPAGAAVVDAGPSTDDDDDGDDDDHQDGNDTGGDTGGDGEAHDDGHDGDP